MKSKQITFCLIITVLMIFLFSVPSIFAAYEINNFPDDQEEGYTWYRGCATTSVAMVLNYFGNERFPNMYVEPTEFIWSGPDAQEKWWIPDWMEFGTVRRYNPRSLSDEIVANINATRTPDSQIPLEGEGDYGIYPSEYSNSAVQTASSYGYDGFNSQVLEFDYNQIKSHIDKNEPVVLAYNVEPDPYQEDVVSLNRGTGDRDDILSAVKDQLNSSADKINLTYSAATADFGFFWLLDWDPDNSIWNYANKEYREGVDYEIIQDDDNYFIDWSLGGEQPAAGESYKVACQYYISRWHAVPLYGYDYSGTSHIFKYFTTWYKEPEFKNFDDIAEKSSYTYIKPPPQPIDLVFVIDTTGSMYDDIAAAKVAAVDIVDEIDSQTSDYRIAVVDFRDFPVYPYGAPGDYEYNDVLDFSNDKAAIVSAIQGLSLGNGWDWPESHYSALMHTFQKAALGGWRDNVKKVAVVMTDAPPHDPEPFTGYVAQDVIDAAIALDPVIIYPIMIGSDSIAEAYMETLSEGTAGEVFNAANAGEVVEAIMEAIEITFKAPTAEANGPYAGNVGETITFDATASYDPDGEIVLYEWDFESDGVYDASGVTPTATYSYPSEFIGVAQLRVTDNDGLTSIDIAPVEITQPADPADLNFDGCVDRADYSLLVADVRDGEPNNPEFDLNKDGVINIADARFLVTQFTNPRGAPCE